jgi:hypothetical protein
MVREIMSRSKNPTLFYGPLVLALFTLIACIYYVVPGFSHILVTHDPLAMHPTHAAAFAALTVVCVIAALVNRPGSAFR